MTLVEIVLLAIISFLFGLLVLGFALHKKKVLKAFEMAQSKSQKIIDQTHRDADRIIKSAIQESKEESQKRRKVFEEEIRKKKSELSLQEQKYKAKEKEVENIQDEINLKEKKLRNFEQKLIAEEKSALRLKAEYELSIEKNQKTLEKIAKMSASEAKRKLMDILEETARKECYPEVKKIEQEAYKKASQKAKKLDFQNDKLNVKKLFEGESF